MAIAITKWSTKDGMEFESLAEAERYEEAMSLCNPQTVASEVHDESVYGCLCWKDSRYPMYVCRYLDEEEQIPRINCSCDNCFYGRDRLAVEIIRLRG